MSTIDDFGGTGQPLNAPALGGPTGWAAAVRDAIKALEANVLSLASTVTGKVDVAGDTMTGPLTVPGIAVTGAATFAQTPTIGTDVLARLWTGSQAQYDAIGTYDPDTLYVVI